MKSCTPHNSIVPTIKTFKNFVHQAHNWEKDVYIFLKNKNNIFISWAIHLLQHHYITRMYICSPTNLLPLIFYANEQDHFYYFCKNKNKIKKMNEKDHSNYKDKIKKKVKDNDVLVQFFEIWSMFELYRSIVIQLHHAFFFF